MGDFDSDDFSDIDFWKICTCPYGESRLRVHVFDKYNRYSKDLDLYLDLHNLIKHKRQMPNSGDIITIDHHILVVKYVHVNSTHHYTEYIVTLETSEIVRND